MTARTLCVMFIVACFAQLCRSSVDAVAEERSTDDLALKDNEKEPSATTRADTQRSDAFRVPDGSAEDLAQFIEDLRGMRPTGRTRAEMIESVKRVHAAMVIAADKILAATPTDSIRAEAISAKLEALGRLSQFGQKGAEEKLQQLANELKQSSDVELAKQSQSILLQLRAGRLMLGETEGAEELLAEVSRQLSDAPDDIRTVKIALGIAQALEYSGKTDKLAIKAYHDFATILAKSSNNDVLQYAEQLEGIFRRLELVGKPIEINGTRLDGKPFDQSTLKGKVVLVDFWATWCNPCIVELPNVLEIYRKYHAKGFEIVGVSLDQNRQTLEAFVKDRSIPWVILYEDSADGENGSNSLANKYGVMGVPTVILVGADGNVVSLNARGEKLEELLEKLLGPVEDRPDVAAEKSVGDKS